MVNVFLSQIRQQKLEFKIQFIQILPQYYQEQRKSSSRAVVKDTMAFILLPKMLMMQRMSMTLMILWLPDSLNPEKNCVDVESKMYILKKTTTTKTCFTSLNIQTIMHSFCSPSNSNENIPSAEEKLPSCHHENVVNYLC